MSDNKFYYTGESRGDWDSESVCDSVDAAVDAALDGCDPDAPLPETVDVYVLDEVPASPSGEVLDVLVGFVTEDMVEPELSDILSTSDEEVVKAKCAEFLQGLYGALKISMRVETTETVTVNVQDWLASHPEERAALEKESPHV